MGLKRTWGFAWCGCWRQQGTERGTGLDSASPLDPNPVCDRTLLWLKEGCLPQWLVSTQNRKTQLSLYRQLHDMALANDFTTWREQPGAEPWKRLGNFLSAQFSVVPSLSWLLKLNSSRLSTKENKTQFRGKILKLLKIVPARFVIDLGTEMYSEVIGLFLPIFSRCGKPQRTCEM